ncbi:hypothetical protein L218DRAFT_999687 [Marasmius fiardii PR-910]|nr:hypothetical protein L218DRAFT_999687 [Marasmius fiardii PR-910]
MNSVVFPLPVSSAQALVRAGHFVVGLTRSQTKAKQLAAQEIVPVVGDPSTPSEWISIVCDIDVVIEAVAPSLKLSKTQIYDLFNPQSSPTSTPLALGDRKTLRYNTYF